MLACASQAEPLRVTVLLAEEGTAYREFSLSFEDAVARQKIPLTLTQAQALPPDADLIVAVGIKSAAIALNSRAPVLCVLVSKAAFEKLLHDSPAHREKNTFSAIYLDQPGKRQLELIVAALPDVKNIGLLYSSLPADIADLRKAVSSQGLVLHEQQSAESLHRDLQAVLQKSEVLLALPDAQIYNASNIRQILLETYRNGNPVIGISPAYVRAGALCAVYSTPELIAVQAAYLSNQFIATGLLPSAQYPNEFEVLVNQQVARSLGIQIPESTTLLRQIKAAESGRGK